jgi:hypothetical protein
MAHPGDHGSFGPFVDGDSLRPGHGAAADRRGVVGHGPCQAVGKLGVVRMKGKEGYHRPEEILDVLGPGLLTAAGIGLFLLCETFGGPFGFEI